MFLSRTIKTLAIVAGFYSAVAHAGQNLHFKQGSIDTNNRAQMMNAISGPSTHYQVIQFKKAITQADRQSLKAQGAEIIGYIPDDAYLVKVNPNQARSLQGADGVQAMVPYAPQLKVSPSFGVIDHLSQQRTEKIVISTFSQQDRKALENTVAQMGQLQYSKGRSLGLIAPLAAVEAISQIEGVEWIEPYPEFQFQNFQISQDVLNGTSRNKSPADLEGTESGTKVMNFEAAWNRGFTGKGQLVGFSDTGLDSGNIAGIHQDFQGQVAKGYAYGLLSASWNDPMGHGTHVAGSIAGNGRASNGVVRGGAYEAQLIAGGMWSQLLNNMIPPQDITVMFADAYKDGARIHTNSWGSPRDLGAYDQFAQTVDQFMWDNPDMLLMFAAGNSGTDDNNDGRVDEDSIGSPATAKNVLSVGASENLESVGGIQRKIGDLKKQNGDPLFSAEPIASDTLSDDPNGIAAFSSRGPTDDGRTKPDVVAPGANILSVRSQVDGANELWGALSQDYVWSGGTSMSTPLVAGSAAVLRQYLASNGINTPSAALVKGLLMHTSTDLYPGQFGQSGKASGQEMLSTRPNPHQGFGRVDMDAVTSFMDNAAIVSGEVSSGSSVRVQIPQSMGSRFKVTMIYTDAPGAPSSGKALVNNLDLKVFEGGQMIAQGTDGTNNFEYLEIGNVGQGAVEIEVIAANMPTPRPNGKLPFELIVTPL